MASRGLEALATSDGFPDKIVDAQPQSDSTSVRVDCIFVVEDSFKDCKLLLVEVTRRDPLLDQLGWFSENAATSLVDVDNAKSKNAAILILFVDTVDGLVKCDAIRRRTRTIRLRQMLLVFRLEKSVLLSNMFRTCY